MSAILESSPPTPRSHNRQLSPALETIILKALDRNPDLRYQSARELRVDLERLGQGGLTPAARPKQPRGLALGAITALVVVAVLTALIVTRVRDRAGRLSPAPSTAAVKSRRSLAVLGFKNLSGRQDEAWISTAIAEMLTTEMAAGEQLRTISGEDVVRTKLDLALPDGDTFGRETLGRIRGHLGSDLLVLGSYLALGKESGGRIRLDFRLQDTVSGETVTAASESGTESELIDLVARTGAQLRQRLGIEPLSASGASGLRASLPSSPEAARLYAEGLARLRVFEALQARELLERAVAADPNHAPAHSALAAAWSALGYDNRAQEQAKLAIDRASALSREERLSIEGRYREF
jgi:TolB-like protein